MIVIIGKMRRTTLFDNTVIYGSIEDNLCCSTGFTTSTASTALKFRTGDFCAGLVFENQLYSVALFINDGFDIKKCIGVNLIKSCGNRTILNSIC